MSENSKSGFTPDEGAITYAADATPEDELKTLCEWIELTVNDIDATTFVPHPAYLPPYWVQMIALREAVKALRKALQ